MAAGLGFKDFTTGEVLTAADVDGYLMQGIWVFASAAARDAAVTSPQEGNACYLKDTNQVLTYSGSAWVAVGGGSPLTTKGDLYTYSTLDTRIGVGANDTVLTADSSTATGLKWAAAATGLTLLATKTLSGSSTNTISSISQSYKSLYLAIVGMNQTSNGVVEIKPNGTTSLYAWGMIDRANTTTTTASADNSSAIPFAGYNVSARDNVNGAFLIHNYTTTNPKMFHSYGRGQDSGTVPTNNFTNGIDRNTAAITSIDIVSGSNATSGTAYLYGI